MAQKERDSMWPSTTSRVLFGILIPALIFVLVGCSNNNTKTEVPLLDDDVFEWRRTIGWTGTTYGVMLRDGMAAAWADGQTPLANPGTLPGNLMVSGVAPLGLSWMGRLIGLTPQAEPVAGDVDLHLYFDSNEYVIGEANDHDLFATLRITSLESWATIGEAGQPGTGAQWGSGRLTYSLAVYGNTFRRLPGSGGDEGMVVGAFYGSHHETAGGTIERDDLTAAFGAER